MSDAFAADRRLAEIMQCVAEACFALDTAWCFTFVNDRTLTLFRHSRDEMMGRVIWDIVPEVVGTSIEGACRRSMADQIPETFEVFFPVGQRWLHVRLRPAAEGLTAFLLDISDRKQAEAASAESEARLQTVVENLTEGLVIADLEGNFLHWNRAALEMHGFRGMEEGSRCLHEFAQMFELGTLDGRVLPVAEWPLPRIMCGETLRHVDMRVRRLDADRVRVFSYSGAIVRESTGRHVAFVSITDITEPKRAQEQLTASLKEVDDLKAALDQHAIVAITDAKGRITFVNDKFCAISKYSRAELLGHDHRIINSNHHPKEFIRELWQTIQRGQVWHGEIRNRAKDGTFYWVATTIVPFLNADGTPRQYVAIRADITERKRAEETLTASFREIADLKAALDEHAIVAITDPRGKITYVNDKFCAISKYSRDELLGQDHRIINSSHHPNEFIGTLWHTIARGQVWHGEIKNRAKDGTFYWVDTTIVPFVDAHGKPRQYVAIRADITERKQAEDALRDAKEGLEVKVGERTAELLNAKDRAEAADRLKSEFLAAMSHELRTPLNGIIGFTELIHDEKPGPLNPKQKKFAAEVLSSGRHLLQLINDVLDLSKIEAGRMEVQLEAFSLAEVIDEVCTSMAPLAEKKRLQMLREIESLPVRVSLDRKKVKQVLYNLISNAIKFTPDGGQITVTATQSGQRELRLQVLDTGIGIKPEDLGKLFVEFQQIASGEARRQQGTGLGLALAKKLVELHGGSIAVRSAPGSGTTFTVVFPLLEPPPSS